MTPYIIVGVIIFSYFLNYITERKIKTLQNEKKPFSISGEDIARKILDYHNINDVTFKRSEEEFEHLYHPIHKYIQFGPDVYQQKTIYSVVLGAHEACHAVDFQLYRLLIMYVDKVLKFVFVPSLIAAFFLDYSWLHSILLWSYLFIIAFKIFIIVRDEMKMNRMAYNMLKQITELSPQDLKETKRVLHSLNWTYISSIPIAFDL